MEIYEGDLRGIGRKFEIKLDESEIYVIIIHNNGRREVYRKDSPDTDGEKIMDLSDHEARVMGTILEGAYFQPIRTDSTEAQLSEDIIIEWWTLTNESPILGQTLGEAELRSRTGVTISAIIRGDDVISNPDPNTTFHAGDKLVAIGSSDEQDSLEQLLYSTN
ncbi:TrkA C-terminal domain-containing protein [Natrialba sp. PRR66]|uniref:cation:proton antiporter regulatory subunit n=1 Tax=Natrialba sp. PRR66 TaxID=3098146 RepID=UPI002B1D45F4|nr:TrkA C-terminal domain-containing protein [Natrialba sp. PRR66]